LTVKNINFMYCGPPYNNVLDSIIDPIIKYLPDATKLIGFKEGQINVCFFIEVKKRNVVFMSHGMGDKGWRDGRKVKNYDYVCVSGPAWKEKLINQGVDGRKVLVNGYTKLDPIFQNYERLTKTNNKIRVVYAPTHNTNLANPKSISSYPRMMEYLETVPGDIELIISAHPYNNNGVITFDSFKWADVIISDCSSIIYEAFALGIPVVFPDWLVKDNILRRCPGSFTEKIYTDDIGYHAADIKQLWELVWEADSYGLNNRAKEFIERIFPLKLRGNSGRVTAEILLRLANS
jgi:CDP-glycerol glycerophosphotransferase (TagB/SpsB family)